MSMYEPESLSAYRAEMLVRYNLPSSILRVAINGGCKLAPKCKGTGDNIAEQIQMLMPNSGTVTASWIPKTRKSGSTFTATFAGYQDQNGQIRFDNARDRDVLHVDIDYRGSKHHHDERMNLASINVLNRRRVALISLMRELELNVDWHIPIWFYMPWTAWWPEYVDFPVKLKERKPEGILVSQICEAVLAYLSFSDSPLSVSGMVKATTEAVDDAMDRINYELRKAGEFEFTRNIYGDVIIIPFPMFAPPGSRLEGPDDLIKRLIT